MKKFVLIICFLAVVMLLSGCEAKIITWKSDKQIFKNNLCEKGVVPNIGG